MNRRAFLGALVCASQSVGRPGPSRPAPRRAIGYLSRRQDKDGGWHSTTYGLLRSGQSLTPLVLNALLDAAESASTPRIQRALKFLERNISPEGALGLADELMMPRPTTPATRPPSPSAPSSVLMGRSTGSPRE
jgi:hypothetical protein